VIAAVLTDDVVAVTFDELPLDEERALRALHPEEEALVATASPKRRAEFAAARACAHEALRRLGRPAVPVLRGGRGMPLFPPGVVGTLTHCAGLRAAALADSGRVRSLGVDVEVHAALPDRVLDTVSLPEEARWARAALADEPRVRWDTLLFTAKEATYKAWYPLTRRWLGFADARITVVPEHVDAAGARGRFRSEVLVDPTAVDGGPPLVELHGRWAVRGDHVASGIVLGTDDAARGADDSVER